MDTHATAADAWDHGEDAVVVMEIEILERSFVLLLQGAEHHALEESTTAKEIQEDTFVNEFLRQALAHP